ncbi:peroxisome biogenesis factor 2-like [Patiria miniata]|uniref:Peroxisome biogenesis factor 2 n=1 Tax=Patiria miniata TaxID=46514 RepID=A0A914BMG6_PATMI|nr:peroxisome biogenesis factor 2-like [Patiria miniata]
MHETNSFIGQFPFLVKTRRLFMIKLLSLEGAVNKQRSSINKMAATKGSSENKETGTGSRNQVVLRVSQLDSSQLDSELHQLLKSQFQRIFQFFKPGVLAYIEPELNAALRLLTWQFSINTIGATLGQRIMNLKYGSEASMTPDLGHRQRLLYACILIGAKWLQERSADLSSSTNHIEAFRKIWKALYFFEKLLSVASLVNFLVFLQDGRYQFLHERLLGIRAQFAEKQSIRQVSFEFMTRELLWHGFAEFLFFLLPFVNFRRIRNFLQQKLFRPSPSQRAETGAIVKRDRSLYKECAVCGEWPTIPRHIGCHHVFCYYCVQSNFLADPSYTCPLCSHPVDDVTNIQPITCDVG